jgi:hypothetical protein
MQATLVNFVVSQVLLLLDAEVEVLVEKLRGGGAVVEVGVDQCTLSTA